MAETKAYRLFNSSFSIRFNLFPVADIASTILVILTPSVHKGARTQATAIKNVRDTIWFAEYSYFPAAIFRS